MNIFNHLKGKLAKKQPAVERDNTAEMILLLGRAQQYAEDLWRTDVKKDYDESTKFRDLNRQLTAELRGLDADSFAVMRQMQARAATILFFTSQKKDAWELDAENARANQALKDSCDFLLQYAERENLLPAALAQNKSECSNVTYHTAKIALDLMHGGQNVAACIYAMPADHNGGAQVIQNIQNLQTYAQQTGRDVNMDLAQLSTLYHDIALER